MPVKIRLTRRGRKKLSLYDIVISDSRSPRDGKFIEKIGSYNPTTHPATIVLNDDKALDWVMKGAQPTDTVRNLLSVKGIMYKKHLQVGVNKGSITQAQADKKYSDWASQKDTLAESKATQLASKKDESKKNRLAAEAKVNEARALQIKTKNLVVETAANAVETLKDAAEATADVVSDVAHKVADVVGDAADAVKEAIAPKEEAAEEKKEE